MKLWTEATAKAAADTLRGYGRVIDALPEISRVVGFEVTANALEKGLKAAGLGITGQYLNANEMKARRTRLADLPPLERAEHDALAKVDREIFRVQGRSEFIAKMFAEAVAKLQPCTFNVVREVRSAAKRKGSEVIWADLSDCQLGTFTHTEFIGRLGPGNSWAMFLKKCAKWEAELIAIIREREQHVRVENVVIAMLGDIVDGSTMRAGHAHDLDREVFDQSIQGAEMFANAFGRIATTFPHLKFRLFSVAGNHGRIGKYGEEPFRSSFDRLVAHLIELRLHAARVKNIECVNTETWFQVVEIHNRKHLLIHGDDSGGGSLPYNALTRMATKNASMMKMNWFAVHCGHHHAEATISHTAGHILLSGNWCGATEFSKRIVEANIPVQLVYGLTAEDGLAWTRRIHLVPGIEAEPKVKVHRITGA